MISSIIVAISVVGIFCVYLIKPQKKRKCPWHSVNHKKINKSTKIACDKLIDGIEKLKITYFIAFGSLLEAYRDGFLNYKDHDIDIMVPIWQNKHIFGCSEYKPVNPKKYNNVSIKLTNKFKICNNNFSYYHNKFEKYIRSLKIKEVRFVVKYTRNTIIYLDGLIYKYELDTWLMISNEWAYRDINICECEFCGRMVKCLKNPLKSILIDYGSDWMIPKSKPGAAPLYIDSVD